MEGGHWKTCGGHGLGDGNVWTLSHFQMSRQSGLRATRGMGMAENERMMVVEQVPRYMDAPLFKHENKPTGHCTYRRQATRSTPVGRNL